jgi:LPXTG-site transpeptidase (sortase) family protein
VTRRTIAVLLPCIVLAALLAAGSGAGAAPDTTAGLARQLRYIGRDTATGMPRTIDDKVIQAAEQAIERYGDDQVEPVPPPPVTGVDVARVRIPAIGVDAAVGRYGVDGYGRLDVPQDGRTVGWNPAFVDLPGTGGSTFFAGHYEYGGVPAVFSRLSTLKEGDLVTVTLSDGSEYQYRVTSVVDYALGAIDMGALFQGREGVESITLMTCSGPTGSGDFAYRTVVLAERAP